MKVSAIICEYNPFHNGHKYQFDEIRKAHDAVICIMSGEFVQRGDVAIYDKWTRAKAALLNGADLVVELPVCYALNTAERFAYGAVELAEKTGIINSLCFGSESGDIKQLTDAADLLVNEPDEVSVKIQAEMKKGLSYPKAREKGYSSYITKELISEPNNILALEYIKALKKLHSTIKPITIKRHMSSHHDTDAVHNISSATSIRNLILKGKDFYKFIPKNCHEIYKNSETANASTFDNILVYMLKTIEPEKLAQINDVTEGLENRLINAANHSTSIEDICSFVKTKRYTYTRIKRILFSLLLGLTKDIAQAPCQYLRVLGMNECGMNLLSQIKENSELTIITKPADFKGFNKSFDLDMKSGDIYSMCFSKNNYSDFTNSPIILK